MPNLRSILMTGLVLVSWLNVVNAQQIPAEQLRVQPAPLLLADPVTPGDRLGHLRDAEAHLRAAGEDKLADEISKQIASEQKQVESLLSEKRKQLEALSQQIAELERLSEAGNVVEFECLILQTGHGNIQSLEGNEGPSAFVLAAASRDIVEAAKKRPDVTVLSRPLVRTLVGQVAEVHMGQQVPIVRPTSASDLEIDMREVGLSLKITPRRDGRASGVLNVDVRLSHSDADFEAGVKVGDINVPAVHESQASFGTRMGSGDTMCVVLPNGEQDVVAFIRQVAVTDSRKR
ncbi:MAG: hypothetical protein KDA88_19715 [Planctomycetaceae bacterium]|nr:hypothetical protein [Planctomycetaceae bacterium]MCB9952502.1 hypothetical protein [Planctomycetaceae bacterium]